MDHSFSTIISPLWGWVIYLANYSGSQRKTAFRTTQTSERSKVCSSRSSCFSATPSGSNIPGPSSCYKPSTPPGVAYSGILIHHGFHPRLLTFKPFGLGRAILNFIALSVWQPRRATPTYLLVKILSTGISDVACPSAIAQGPFHSSFFTLSPSLSTLSSQLSTFLPLLPVPVNIPQCFDKNPLK